MTDTTWGLCDKCNRVLWTKDLPRCPECTAEFGAVIPPAKDKPKAKEEPKG